MIPLDFNKEIQRAKLINQALYKFSRTKHCCDFELINPFLCRFNFSAPLSSNENIISVNNHDVGQRYIDTLYTQVEISEKKSAEGRFNSGKLRSNSKRSETKILNHYLSEVEIRRTAKLRFLKSSVQHWKWWLCKSSRGHLQLLLGLQNIWYGCHSRFLSASEASDPPRSHISTSPSARGDVCRSAVRWKWAPRKMSHGMLCGPCPTPPGDSCKVNFSDGEDRRRQSKIQF